MPHITMTEANELGISLSTMYILNERFRSESILVNNFARHELHMEAQIQTDIQTIIKELQISWKWVPDRILEGRAEDFIKKELRPFKPNLYAKTSVFADYGLLYRTLEQSYTRQYRYAIDIRSFLESVK